MYSRSSKDQGIIDMNFISIIPWKDQGVRIELLEKTDYVGGSCVTSEIITTHGLCGADSVVPQLLWTAC